MFVSEPSKVKCRSIKKKTAVGAGSSPHPKPEPQGLEEVSFSSLRSERDRIKYIRRMAERKIKVRYIYVY